MHTKAIKLIKYDLNKYNFKYTNINHKYISHAHKNNNQRPMTIWSKFIIKFVHIHVLAQAIVV